MSPFCIVIIHMETALYSNTPMFRQWSCVSVLIFKGFLSKNSYLPANGMTAVLWKATANCCHENGNFLKGVTAMADADFSISRLRASAQLVDHCQNIGK